MSDFNNITGAWNVEFTNGKNVVVNVARNILDPYGHPVYLEAKSGTLYNWQNIISIKRMPDRRETNAR
jgi:hypothetical protein